MCLHLIIKNCFLDNIKCDSNSAYKIKRSKGTINNRHLRHTDSFRKNTSEISIK